MRNAASIARGACSETSEPSVELISRLKLMTPSPIVTGSIRASTWRTRSSRSLKANSNRKCTCLRTGRAIANWTAVPTSTPMA